MGVEITNSVKNKRAIIAGIAMYNQNKKPRSEQGTFNGRAIRAVVNAGGSSKNVIDVHTGEEFVNALINLSSKAPIKKLYVASHSSGIGLYANSNSGFYTSYATASINNFVTDDWADFDLPTDKARYLSDLSDNIKSGNIKFQNAGFVIFLGCNTATSYLIGTDSFAEDFSEAAPNINVIGAKGYSSPNDKEEKSFIAREKNNPSSKEMGWVQYKNGKKIREYGSIYTMGTEQN